MFILAHTIFATALLCSIIILPINILASDPVNTGILDRNGKTPYAIYNSCGGIIQTKCDQTIILDYKPDEEYDNNEFCVWEIRNRECFGSVITKMKSGFEVGYDYIQITGFEKHYEMQTGPTYNEKMGSTSNMEQISKRAYVNFLIFTTDNSNTGTGFRIEIVGWSPTSSTVWSDPFISTSPNGNTTLKPYFANMFQSFVIAPKPGNVPSLVLDIEHMLVLSDYLTVFTMERNGQSINFRPQNRHISGNGTATFEAVYYTNFVVLFYSYSSRVVPDYAGVTLKWYPADKFTNGHFI